jgi:hypothetical protein
MPSPQAVPSDERYDRLMVALAAWFIIGLFADGWSHYHDVRESFFTPYHAVLYAGFFANVLGVAIPLLRNMRRGYSWRTALPPGYDLTALGVAIFAIGVFPDLTWHRVFGIEEGIDVLISPTHLSMGVGLALIVLGPTRSALRRAPPPATLEEQLPMVLSLGLFLAEIEFTLQFAFDAGISTSNAPLSPNGGSASNLAFFLLPFTYYKEALGITIVVIHAALLAGFALYAVTVVFTLPALLMATLLASDALSVYVPVVEALLAGAIADGLVAWLKPEIARPREFRLFAIAVPVAVQAAYLAFSALLQGGVWWDVNMTYGSLLFAGVAGVLLSFLMQPPKVVTSRA